MKTTKSFLFLWSMIFLILLGGCSDEKDGRLSQDPQIVAVKVNEVLYSIDNLVHHVDLVNHVATFVLPSGMDLSSVKVEVLAANSTVELFNNKTVMDVKQPLSLTLKSYDGEVVDWTLRIQSPPKLTGFSIEGMYIDMKYVFAGSATLVVQVPEDTDLTALKVSMTFVNGTLHNFTNGTPLDYTDPRTLEVLGVDGTTIYNFLYIITTDPVGPANITEMTVNGVPADSVVINGNIAMPYIHEWMPDFSNVDVTVTPGYAQTVDASFTGEGLNLISGNPTVKITGTDGIQITFTIGTPKIVIPPLCSVDQTDITGTGNTSVRGAAFSGKNVVLSAQQAGAGYIYDFEGTVYDMPIEMPTSPSLWGMHKVASDDEGVMLFADLGINGENQTVFKCDGITGTLTPYIQFTGTSIGSALMPGYRNAGLKIQGKLSGNAVIALSTANTNEVFIWSVTGGVLNTTPKKYIVPYSFSNYWTVTPVAADPATTTYITTGVGNDHNGFIYSPNPGTGNSFSTIFKISNWNLSDCAVTTFNGRTYMAYNYLIANNDGAQMRVCDITDGTEDAFSNPILDITWESNMGSIGNSTMATDIKVIDGKLYVVFLQTSIGFRVYSLNP